MQWTISVRCSETGVQFYFCVSVLFMVKTIRCSYLVGSVVSTVVNVKIVIPCAVIQCSLRFTNLTCGGTETSAGKLHHLQSTEFHTLQKSEYLRTAWKLWSLQRNTISCAATQECSRILRNPAGSSLHSQEPSNCSYPEPDQSRPYHHILSPRLILILSTHLRLGQPCGLFPPGFPTNNLYTFLFSTFVLHALPISSSSTWSF
jgi:hypothetical protein